MMGVGGYNLGEEKDTEEIIFSTGDGCSSRGTRCYGSCHEDYLVLPGFLFKKGACVNEDFLGSTCSK